MSKLYYDDALAAAYMAREFGIKSQYYDQEAQEFKDERIRTIYESIPYNNQKFYIHPDSYSVFEPIVGDLITSRHKYELDKRNNEFPCDFLVEKTDELFPITSLSQFILTKDNIEDAFEYYGWEGQKIIQRNGKLFFTPLREE